MNSKNILIAIGVLGIGLILYKVLLGFVLPIALFVALGYVLKFLLKVPESDSEKELSRDFANIESPSSIDKIVEIQPIEEDNSNEVDKSIDTVNSTEVDKSIDEGNSTEVDEPIDEEKSDREANIS